MSNATSEPSDELEAALRVDVPRTGRPTKHDVENWIVTDDWPERVPVTDDEVAVFEACFGDILDEFFGPS